MRLLFAFVIAPLVALAESGPGAQVLHAQAPGHPGSPAGDTATAVVTVRVTSAGTPVETAVVRSGTGPTALRALTDARGVATLRLSTGPRWVIASKVGYDADSIRVVIRAGRDTSATLALRDAARTGARDQEVESDEQREHAASLSGVIVTATRTQRRVEAEPTRVDVLGREEIEERSAMSPGNSAMLLSETGGVHVAATSPGLGGANVRIQGVRGRYTQLLSDGLPLYGLTTEGLGLLQIPPLDLRQVELIKGGASAMYGPGALGGVINFVSRRPPVLLADTPRAAHEARELYVNQTTQGGTDLALFDARALSSRWGYTLLASGDRQGRRDLNGDGWADVPGFLRAVVRPRVYWSGADGSDLFLTTGLTAEDRRGGTVDRGVLPAAPGFAGGPFAQTRDTRRADGGVVGHLALGAGRTLALRGSMTSEWRRATYGLTADRERDRRSTLFGEATLTLPVSVAQEFVVGTALQRDGYTPRDVPALAYLFTAPALFAQHTWTPAPSFGLTSSVRLDGQSAYGTTVSPRVSGLVRPWSHGPLSTWTARVSGGIGTYAPTPFLEEIEEIGLRHLRPITRSGATPGVTSEATPGAMPAAGAALESERAQNGAADVGGVLGPIEVNAAIYASVIDRAVGLRPVAGSAVRDSVELVNAASPTRTRGAQLFVRYRSGELSMAGSYEYQRATEQDIESAVTGTRRGVPLTPRHAAGLTASLESESGAGISLEGFYVGRQPLADDPYRSESRAYVLVGALIRKRLGTALLYVNGENLGNVRQTHVDPLLRGAPGVGGRWTTEVWAPLEGAVVNAGIRVAR